MTPAEQQAADIANYGFIPDRAAALGELMPPLVRVITEHPSHPVQREYLAKRAAEREALAGMDPVSAWQ